MVTEWMIILQILIISYYVSVFIFSSVYFLIMSQTMGYKHIRLFSIDAKTLQESKTRVILDDRYQV